MKKRAVHVIIHNHVHGGGDSSRWKRLKWVIISGVAGFLAGGGLIQLLM